MTAAAIWLDLYEDNGGGLHICAVNQHPTTVDDLAVAIYHHVELAMPPDAVADALAILAGDTSDWTIDIDHDASNLLHPETHRVATFILDDTGSGYWDVLDPERLGHAAREYLGIPRED